ncbi:MAG: 5-deoxy-glucuronate isomerase, partial [Spirochaetaceae bacterium]|nr:5-deoxy-glucuronate isomerase [Spirochaetaceae bacterium]
MQIRHKAPFSRGYTPLSERRTQTADMLMDFGVIRLFPGDVYESDSPVDERVFLLSHGNARISWNGEEREISRPNLFDYSPWCLSVPAKCPVSIRVGNEGAEFYYCATDNPKDITARLFSPEECKSELRGKGTMRETSTRIVRTIFDDSNRPESNLVIGEVIGVPGKWS